MVLTTPKQTTGITTCKPSSNGYFVNGSLDITIFDGFSPNTACCKQPAKNYEAWIAHTLADNIADLFAASGNTPIRECYPSNSTCDFRLSDHSNYNSTANYSRVGFQTGIVPGKESSQPDTGVLTFRTFEGADCASDHNHNWHQWSCDTYIGDCSTTPYSVRSFSISATPEANKTGCYVASERAKTEAPSDGNKRAWRPGPCQVRF